MHRMLLHVTLHTYQPPCHVQLNAAPRQLTTLDGDLSRAARQTEGQEEKVR